MRARPSPMPLAVEFFLVVGLTFGLMFCLQLGTTFHGGSATLGISETTLVKTLVFELLTGAGAVWFLRANGWRLEHFHLEYRAHTPGVGLALFLLVYLMGFLLYTVMAGFARQGLFPANPLVHGPLSLPMVLACCVVNPLFEEGILLGYVVRALDRHGLQFAVGLSVILRFSAHLYQGAWAIATILPMGLLFGLYYWRFRKLWPPLLAHALLDAIPLLRSAG